MNAQEAGLRLRVVRKEKGISLDRAAKATHIRQRFLDALEEGNFELLPSPVQVRGFLRAYAEYLDIDPDEIIRLLESQAGTIAPDAEDADGLDEILPDIVEDQTDNIFVEIGEVLRQRRELLTLTYGEIEERIRISELHLERLEKGEFDSFPSPTQARGMLHNYANFLGLESQVLLLRYAEGIQSRFLEQQEQEGDEPPSSKSPFSLITVPLWLRRIFSRENLTVGFIAVALFSLFLWGVSRISATSSEQDIAPTAPPLADLLLTSPTVASQDTQATSSDSDPPEEPGVEATPTPNGDLQITVQVANPRNVEIQLMPNQRVWVRVTADGEIAFEGRLVPGETYGYSANDEVLVFTGNASALRVFLNGRDLGVQGIEGEVVDLLYSAEGLATPTASSTPTIDANAATETPNPSSNPSPTVDAGGAEQ